jgi:hypothetical protein
MLCPTPNNAKAAGRKASCEDTDNLLNINEAWEAKKNRWSATGKWSKWLPSNFQKSARRIGLLRLLLAPTACTKDEMVNAQRVKCRDAGGPPKVCSKLDIIERYVPLM